MAVHINGVLNFSGGTLQAGGTAGVSATVNVGTASSSVATVDANGNSLTLNHYGATLSGPGRLIVIDSAGGGIVVSATLTLRRKTATLAARRSCLARWKC